MHPFAGVEQNGDNPASLNELLNETRIILPGTEVFLAFLVMLPFSNKFDELGRVQRSVYLSTFFATLLALACFVAPAAYHRIARPIRDKPRFKAFANVFLVVGLVPVSLAIVLSTYLVTSVVLPVVAPWATAAMALVITVLWWVVPLTRAHDRFPTNRKRRAPWPGATLAETTMTRR